MISRKTCSGLLTPSAEHSRHTGEFVESCIPVQRWQGWSRAGILQVYSVKYAPFFEAGFSRQRISLMRRWRAWQ